MNKLNRVREEIQDSAFARFALGTLIVLLLISTFAFMSPYDVNGIDMKARIQPPSLQHPFGTDQMGRDYMTRILYGGRVSLSVGVLSMIISTTIGTLIGTVSGYFQGRLDTAIMRGVDILMCIPSFFIILVLNAYLAPSMKTIVLVIGLLGWMGTARLVRAETMSVKTKEYVLYAQSAGQSTWRIILKHIIPNIIPTIIVSASLAIASAILMESALSYLGMGIQAPQASWGSMLSKAQSYIDKAPYLGIFPGVFILLTVLSFNIIGDVIQKAVSSEQS